MIIYLLRHGLSQSNKKGLVTGTPSDPLTAEGREQSRRAATLPFLYGLSFTHCYVSNWRRAQETAAFFLPEKLFTVDERLGETRAGKVAEWELSRFNEIYPDFWDSFDPGVAYPDGESHYQLYDRVIQWFEDIQACLPHDSTVLAATHAGPICCLIQHICRVSMDHFPMFIPENTSLTRLEQGFDNRWNLGSFSLTAPAGGGAK